jgi:hypothetical protein
VNLYLTSVYDETGAEVEHHEYHQTPVGIVPRTSTSPRDTLEFAFSGETEVASVALLQSIDATRPATATTVSVDPATPHVSSLSGDCVCGPTLRKSWVKDPDGRPRVQSMTRGSPGTQTGLTTTFLYRDGATYAEQDPFDTGLPVSVSAAAADGRPPTRETRYWYQHQLIGLATRVEEPPAVAAATDSRHTVTYDYDNEFGCVEGVAPVPGDDPSIPNEHPTLFLCRIIEEGRDALTEGMLNCGETPEAHLRCKHRRIQRSTFFRYDSKGRLLATGWNLIADITRYTYYPDDPADIRNGGNPYNAGRLWSVTRVDRSLGRDRLAGRRRRL